MAPRFPSLARVLTLEIFAISFLIGLTKGSNVSLETTTTTTAATVNVSSTTPEPSEDQKEFNGVWDNPNLVAFYLYHNPRNPNDHDILEYANLASINASHFNPRRATKFLIHGFTQNGSSSFPTNVKNAYLQHTGYHYNVIAVDWGKLSSPRHVFPLFYELASANVPKVGQRIAEFILFLKAHGLMFEYQVHLVGFSLGAHVASNAGDFIQRHTLTRVARITGLDPAGPGYQLRGVVQKRLSYTDAEFVDVMHTNAGMLGFPIGIGHVDFWPNGGSFQPSCSGEVKPSLAPTNLGAYVAGILSGSCSHGKAPVYFAMSIDPAFARDQLIGCKCFNPLSYVLGCSSFCTERAVLGEYVPQTARGNFYLTIKPLPESAFTFVKEDNTKA